MQEIISVPSGEAEIVRPGAVSHSNGMKNEKTHEEKATFSMAIREMKHMPNIVSLFNSMNLTPQARILLEQAVANVAIQCGGANSLFASTNSLQDYTTDVELLGHPLPILTKPNPHQNSRTELI